MTSPLRQVLAELSGSRLHDLVLREGRTYSPVDVPAELRRRRAHSPHQCFARAFAVADDEWTYVEGFAMDADGLEFPVHHAWLTRSGDEAVDLARPFDPDREYLGIPIELASLGRATLRSGVIGSYLGDSDLHRLGFGPDTLTVAA